MAAPSSADTTGVFETFFSGKLFDSWDEFETTLSQFEKETNSVFRKKNTTTVAFANISRKEPIPERFKYASVCFICQHFGKIRTQSSGQRKRQSYVALDCPVFFIVGYLKGSLRISKSSMCHANHKLEAEANQYLACNRRLTSEEEEAIEDIVKMQPTNADLQNFIREKFDKKVLLTDVKNLKAKLKKKNDDMSSEASYKVVKELEDDGMSSEALYKVAKEVEDDGGLVRMDILQNNTFNILSFCTQRQKQLCQKYPEMFFIDGTYKVNKYDFPLLQIIVIDNFGNSIPIFYSFVKSECQSNIKLMFDHFIDVMGNRILEKNQTWMMDCDKDFVNTAIELFPTSNVLICKFHVMKAFKTRVGKCLIPVTEKEYVTKIFLMILNSFDESSFEESCRLLMETNSEIFEYFHDTWLPLKPHWSMVDRRNVLTFGNNTNNQIELENGQLKSILNNCDSLSKVIAALGKRSSDSLYQSVRHEMTSTSYDLSDINPNLHTFYSEFTDKAVELMIKNHSHLNDCSFTAINDTSSLVTLHAKQYVINHLSGDCYCCFNKQYRLPCIHVVFLVLNDVLSHELLTLNCRWLKTNCIISTSTTPNEASLNVSRSAVSKPLTESQKRHLANETTQRINLALSRMSTEMFEKRMKLLNRILNSWDQGGSTESETVGGRYLEEDVLREADVGGDVKTEIVNMTCFNKRKPDGPAVPIAKKKK